MKNDCPYRKYETYKMALNNEYYLDEYLYLSLGKEKDHLGPIRTLSLKQKINSRSSLLFWALQAIRLFWLFPLQQVFFIKQFIHFLPFVLKSKKTSPLQGRVLICTSSKSERLFGQADWNLTVPWVHVKGSPQNISLFDFLSLLDLMKSFFWASFSSFYYGISIRKPYQHLQTYCSVQWDLAERGLRKCLTNEVSAILSTNHFDRFAVLIDSLPGPFKKILYQHGLLDEGMDLPYKLQNIAELHYYDANSERIFRDKVMKSPDVQVFLSPPPFRVDPGSYTPGSVLIIGQPHCSEKEVEMAKKMLSLSCVQKIIIKPHPKYPDNVYRTLSDSKIELIKEGYPKVDLALSYMSTLGFEYESIAIPVLWHKSMLVDEEISRVKENFAND